MDVIFGVTDGPSVYREIQEGISTNACHSSTISNCWSLDMPINKHYYIIELAPDLIRLSPEDKREVRRFTGIWLMEPVDEYTEYTTRNGIMKCIPFESDIKRLGQELNAH